MAEQKNHNNELNVEDALTQSEAFLVKTKSNHWRRCSRNRNRSRCNPLQEFLRRTS